MLGSHLSDSTVAGSAGAAAGLQVLARLCMPGARLACGLPPAGPVSGSAAATPLCLGAAPNGSESEPVVPSAFAAAAVT